MPRSRVRVPPSPPETITYATLRPAILQCAGFCPSYTCRNLGQHLDDRRKMMQAWADYLDSLKAGGNVVAIGIKAG